jgi:hypothetical protein
MGVHHEARNENRRDRFNFRRVRQSVMMPTAQLAPDISDAIAIDQRCAVCDHDLLDHDAIDLRYCRATQAQVLSRGCICR